MKLEQVVVPVSDVDRARHFYRALGFRLDRDEVVDGFRVVQLTPPGSACSILVGTNLGSGRPGSSSCALRVADLEEACAELRGHGAALGPVRASRVGFSDPDGNEWLLVGG
ncbi:VOC family protein [Kribbella jejuensis]|nr:VOC family protein [Kribbella jejuensis]